MRIMAKRTILEELKIGRPLHSRAQEAAIALLRTAHLLRRRLEAAVAREEITTQQYNVLRILRGARGPLPTMEISGRMIETSCGITRLVTALEEKGLLRRDQFPGDRRQFLCTVTPAGLRVLARLEAEVTAIDESLTSGLSPERLESLLDILAEMRERAAAESAESAPDRDHG